ncbi:hypothetical protein BJ878DRAFT_545019 [Calycina marina]|uniref:Uncharacterized protein n=1 Tax=Calycina marina TaxID=1763456 RepID=A0A9P7YXB1_9HELO|nr:hypothetical protein BJ878DRAFT_545019 [Calycina marina]
MEAPSKKAAGMVVFNSAANTDVFVVSSWANGPQKLTGFEKRGRPKKSPKRPPRSEDSHQTYFTFITYTEAPKRHCVEVQKVVKRNAMHDYRQREREKKRVNKGNLLSIIDVMTNMVLLPVITSENPDEPSIQLDQYMLDRLHTYTTSIYELVYSIEKYADYNPISETWLPMAFKDPALLHCLIFCADGYSALADGVRERPLAVMHLKEASRMVNQRLRGPNPIITDSTLVIVCTLAHAEKLKGNVENWKIHLEGLREMIELRGGMEAFADKRMVQNKIHRADLSGAIDAVEKPYFAFHRESPTIPGTYARELRCFRIKLHMDPRLARISRQIHEVTMNMNAVHQKSASCHRLTIREDITTLQYALLALDFRNVEECEGRISDVLRPAYLMYLVTLLDEALPGTSICDGLGRKLVAQMEALPLRAIWTSEFLLWVASSAASMVRDEGKGCFLVLAASCTEDLGINDWEETEAVSRDFYWIDKTQTLLMSSTSESNIRNGTRSSAFQTTLN